VAQCGAPPALTSPRPAFRPAAPSGGGRETSDEYNAFLGRMARFSNNALRIQKIAQLVLAFSERNCRYYPFMLLLSCPAIEPYFVKRLTSITAE